MSTSAPPRPPGSGPGQVRSTDRSAARAGAPAARTAATRAPATRAGSAATATAPRPLEAAPRQRPALRLVGPSRRLRPRLLGTVLVTIGFVTLFILAAMQALLVQGQLRLDRLNGDIAKAETAKDKLQLQVDTLESPDRLAQEAKQLGMVPAPDVVFLYAPPATSGGSQPATSGGSQPATAGEAPPATTDGTTSAAAADG